MKPLLLLAGMLCLPGAINAAGEPAAPAPAPAESPSPAVSPSPTATPESGETTDASVAARASALEVAGAFSNDGFKTRDGHWIGPIRAKKPKVVQVNLYAGNQYWFIVAASDGAKKLAVSIHDEKGEPVEFHPYRDQGRAAAGFSPEISGPYYVRIEEEEGTPAVFCLLYSYK